MTTTTITAPAPATAPASTPIAAPVGVRDGSVRESGRGHGPATLIDRKSVV